MPFDWRSFASQLPRRAWREKWARPRTGTTRRGPARSFSMALQVTSSRRARSRIWSSCSAAPGRSSRRPPAFRAQLPILKQDLPRPRSSHEAVRGARFAWVAALCLSCSGNGPPPRRGTVGVPAPRSEPRPRGGGDPGWRHGTATRHAWPCRAPNDPARVRHLSLWNGDHDLLDGERRRHLLHPRRLASQCEQQSLSRPPETGV
jgi:hypothetical protein